MKAGTSPIFNHIETPYSQAKNRKKALILEGTGIL